MLYILIFIQAGDSCDVTYSGTLKDGRKFDAGTTSFAPNQVIKVRCNIGSREEDRKEMSQHLTIIVILLLPLKTRHNIYT